MPKATLIAIEYYLPEAVVSNEDLARAFPEWTAEKIYRKLGIRSRHVAGPDELASDLAVAAADKLLQSGVCSAGDIDYLVYCTQSPDHLLPTTACVIAHRLKIPSHCGAIDINLGCSGYVYGLGIAKGLIESRQARRVLLITADTYSKFLRPDDKGTRTLFGDAGAATLVGAVEAEDEIIGPFVYGTDGEGARHLIVEPGFFLSSSKRCGAQTDRSDCRDGERTLHMDGQEIFAFSSRIVPAVVNELLCRGETTAEGIDVICFHQANSFMLEYLRTKCHLPKEKFVIDMEMTGNTVSCTIPIALKNRSVAGRLRAGNRVMLVGFGVGLSWGACLIRWDMAAPSRSSMS